ncbi:MAG TPA: replicative DNA helicase, partial [Verrucomicrobiota bacterium]|nr:replicative DNA helicase [Verrucomicrobiota bacterium]
PNECLGLCLQKTRGAKHAAPAAARPRANWRDAWEPSSAAAVFYDLRHQVLFDVLGEMYDTKAPIDLVTTAQRLKDAGLLEGVGGLAYLSGLPDAVPSAANLEYYLEIMLEKHVLRRMVQTCQSVIARVYDFEGDADELLDEAERDILHISEERERVEILGMPQLIEKAIKNLERRMERQGELDGLPTGFGDFDKMTNGMRPGEMIVIAARPSMGKTSLAMNMAEHVAVDGGLPVGVFSLEMTAESLVERMLCSRSEVNLRDIRDGFFAERELPRLWDSAQQLVAAPLHIDDTPGLSILQLRARARRMHQQHGIKLLVIDYLQLLHSESRKARDNRQQEVAEISSGVKALAKELKIPIIILSQLNRELDKDKSRKPKLSDLREYGAIEQDADVVALLYKPPEGDEDDQESVPRDHPDGISVKLLIAKQRNGPTGDVDLVFFKGFTRFRGAAKVRPDDVPSV